jgi:predicted flap endonuclease-1-like 5' DNA nuclease
LSDLRLQLAERIHAHNDSLAEAAQLRSELLTCHRQVAQLEDQLHTATFQAKAPVTRMATFDVIAAAGPAAAIIFDDFEPINGIGPVFKRRLYDAGITTYEHLAETPAERLVAIVKAKPWQAVDAEFWRRQALEFARAKREGALQTVRRGDDLKVINGIGPVFERRLNEAGIYTFEDLANTEDQRIVDVVKAKSWQAVDPDFWRRQARDLAARK